MSGALVACRGGTGASPASEGGGALRPVPISPWPGLAVVLVRSASWRIKLNSWQPGHQPAAYHTRSTGAAGAAAAVVAAVAVAVAATAARCGKVNRSKWMQKIEKPHE